MRMIIIMRGKFIQGNDIVGDDENIRAMEKKIFRISAEYINIP